MPLDWKTAQTDLVGRTVTVELKHVDAAGKVLFYEHTYGTVVSADKKDGIWIDCAGIRTGTKLALPPYLTNFMKAQKGMYRFETTGEEVEDPDWVSTWTLNHNQHIGVPTPVDRTPLVARRKK
jgi:hypothetical protein